MLCNAARSTPARFAWILPTFLATLSKTHNPKGHEISKLEVSGEGKGGGGGL